MDKEEKTFTTLEVEFLCEFVVKALAQRDKLTDEQERDFWRAMHEGMHLLDRKSSHEVLAEEELQRLIEGKDE